MKYLLGIYGDEKVWDTFPPEQQGKEFAKYNEYSQWLRDQGLYVGGDALADDLEGYHLFHAARADLLRRLGRDVEAAGAYRRALELATNPQERAFLERRMLELGS